MVTESSIEQLIEVLSLNPNDVTSLNDLASLYHDQGNYAQLASLYRNQGNYAQAESLYQRLPNFPPLSHDKA